MINITYVISHFQVIINFRILAIIILTISRSYAVGIMVPVITKESRMTTGASYPRMLPAAKDVVIARWATYPVKLLANLYQPCRLPIYHVLPIKQHWRMYLLTHVARSGPAVILRRNCQVNSSLDEKIHIPQYLSQPSSSQLS